MVFLLTNDDGVEAPGLATLGRVIESRGTAIVLAPDRHLSGCSHQATTSKPLELKEFAEHWYTLDGSPVDCTRVGLLRLAPATQWVLSGINEGGNLGADVYLSGTVAAAREACLLGKPAIAISQYVRRRPIDWRQTERCARQVLELLLERPPEPGSFWNVNLPQLDEADSGMPECVFCQVDPNPLPVAYDLHEGKLHYRARYQERVRADGHDVQMCFSGRITISQICLSVPIGFQPS
ncbi:MAG: 5'/3'-nucleotidase SurE [Planctomycetia bacterium]|nr:5'/3'-nucleotidase SurE [Planctomycetia bacterium]